MPFIVATYIYASSQGQRMHRHGILYYSSVSQKWASTGSKIVIIYSLFRIIFYVLNVLNYVEKTK
jgi:hypothetical protein